MTYIHQPLGRCERGSLVRVDLTIASNVHLVNPSNLRHYDADDGFTSHDGGYFERTPAVLSIPSTGEWHVVVDVACADVDFSAQVTVLPPEALAA